MDIKPVGQLKPINNGVNPVGKLKPVQSNLSPIGRLQEGDSNTVLPTYKTPKDLEVDSAINFIKEKGGRNGSTIMDSEIDVLRDVLKDPRATKEQREKAILTVQGYDSKHDDNNTMYYNKREDNGVYVPTALAYGERPPQGYKTASVWGNKKEAEDDSWYTDLGKSLANGVLGAVGGVFDVAQVGQELVTGSESKYLNKLKNTTEALKFEKDSDLEAPIYNTEGIQTFGDLLDKDRFDLSPKALWGTFNMAAESLTGFGAGVKGASILAKGGKGLVEGLKGVEGAVELGKAAQKAAIFTGSFASQVGDVYDSATETGLKGRDRAAFATSVGGTMAALDAFWGLDGKIMSNMFKKSKKEMLQNLIKTVERDELGNITEQGFKELAKQTTVQYAQLAKNGVKEVVKDAFSEGGQEAAQDFSQKAGEQLWDKLSDEDKAKFGTSATSAKSFGSYINSFSTGLASGAPMAIASQTLKNKHDEQSINAYERVKEGPEATMALKTDLVQSLKAGEITQSEFDQANFKIDSYKKFNEETKGLNLDTEKERKAFELSFQIEGLKTEIPTTPKELDKLAPIPLAAVKSKQDEVNNLQKELTELIGKAQAKAEPLVSKKTQEKVVKETEEQATENKKEIVANLKQKKVTNSKWEDLIDNSVNEKELDAVLDQMDNAGETTPDLADYVGLKRIDLKTPKTEIKKPARRALKRPKEPVVKSVKDKSKFTYIPYKEDKRTYSEIPSDEFNSDTMDSRKVHATFRKELSDETKYPENKVNGVIVPRVHTHDGKDYTTYEFEAPDGKKIRFASSIMREEGYRGHMRTEKLSNVNAKGLPTFMKVVDLGKVPDDYKDKMPEGYASKKKILGIYKADDGSFLGWAKETHRGKADTLDKEGNALYNEAESDLIKHIETKKENPLPGEQLTEIRTPKTPVAPAEKDTQSNKETVTTTEKEAKKEVSKPAESNKESESKGPVLRRKIVGYNQLSKEQKKSDFGVNLRKEIQKEVEDFGGSLKPISGNKIQLLDGDGKQVKQVSVKRDQSVIDEEKAIAVKKKNALNTTPTSISQYLAMVIGAKGQFAESVTKEIPNVPSMMKDFKKGYTLESLLQGYKDRANLNDEAVNESDFNLEAMDFLKEYLIEGGRDLAIKYAVESYEKEINDGYTDKQIKELEAFAKENEIKESDVEKAKEIAQNVNAEEYTQITQKIESKNENERNEQLADETFEDYFGDENGINDVFIKDESKKSGEEKDISKNEYPDDVFQKPAELQYAEGQLKKAEIELTASKKALDAKRKELDKGIIDDREDLFGERKSTDATSLFDERVDLNAREETLAPFKQRYENAQKDFAKQTAKVKELQDKGDSQTSLFQKKAANKANVDKVIAKLQNAMPKVKIVFDDNLEAAGKWSPSNNTITVNPYYAGLDTPIHEAGHVLIDAMGYDNKVIQTAIKQLRGTDLYKETKSRYPELSEHGLDMEVLAEAIGREGADVFNKEADKSKFKGYLEYIFDWLKRKLGLEKNVAKNLAKQIIKGIGTKNLEGTKTGKEQLSKKSKNPLGAKPLRFEQYAAEHGFSYEKETEKLNDASAVLEDAQYEYDLAKEDAEDATTDAEAEKAEAILKEKEVELSKAKKEFAKVGKRTFEYKKYRKDFNAIQKIMAEKEVSDYSTEELQDLISMLHGFDNKAAKAVRQDAMTKLAMIATKKQQEKFKKKEGYIEDLAKTKDISPLQARILHHSHFTENNPDMQAVSLEFGNAVMDKILDANSKKTTHEKLGQKVIAEENKRLGIVGATKNRFSSDSAKYFDWMENENGELLTVEEAKAKGLSEAKVNYLKFTRETIADYKGQLEENDFENAVMDAIRIDKGFMEAYKSEGLLPAFSYYLGGGANNLGKVRILHNGKIMSYAEIEKEILSTANRKSVTSMAKALWDLLVANIQARRQLKKGFNIDEAVNPLELKGEAEYSLNEKGQLVSKFDKPRAKDRGYSKDFYKAMNQFIDESAHVKHISKIMPLVDSVEYLNKNGYMEEGYTIKPNVSKWIEDWKKLHIFKEPHVNDPILDASIKAMRKLVASTTMWFNIPANVLNVFMGNYSNWRQENGKTVALGNKRLFGGNGKNRAYGLDIIKKYNVVNQDYDSNATMKYGAILSKLGTIGTQIGEYQIQGSLGLGLLSEDEFNSFEYTKDKYGNEILTVKPGVDEKALKEKMTQVKNRVTDIQGKYPDEDRRNIMKGEIGKAAFQFKVWIPDYFKERFSSKYYNAYGQEKEGTFTKLLRVGIKEMYADLKKGDFKNIYKNNPSFMSNLKGIATIGTLMALAHQDGDDEEAKKGSLSFQNALSQVLFILDLEQDKYMVSNPVAALGKTKDLLSAFEALVTLDEKAYDKVKRVLPANKLEKIVDFGKKVVE